MGSRTRPRLATLFAAALALSLLLPQAAGADGIKPTDPGSPNAEDTVTVSVLMLAIATVIAVAVNVAIIAAVVRFRSRRGSREPRRTRGRRRTQVGIAFALTVLAAAVLVIGVVSTEDVRKAKPSGPKGLEAAAAVTAQKGLEPPKGGAKPLRIKVYGQQWLWRYEYPDGTAAYYEMVVPEDTTVLLDITSTDVTHRWWIPALGGKFDAIPNSTNHAWFKAEKGSYDGQSAVLSGPAYTVMRARVCVTSVPEYQSWLERQGKAIEAANAAVQQALDSGDPEAPGAKEQQAKAQDKATSGETLSPCEPDGNTS